MFVGFYWLRGSCSPDTKVCGNGRGSINMSRDETGGACSVCVCCLWMLMLESQIVDSSSQCCTTFIFGNCLFVYVV